MGHVLRWGQSAYETDAALAQERLGAKALGHSWQLAAETDNPAVEQADILVVTSRVRVNEEVVARLRGRLVLTTTSGFEHIDRVACAARGVMVGRCPIARRDSVVEHSLWGMLAGLRRTSALQEAAERGDWVRSSLPTLGLRGLTDCTVVVVGLGVIGERMCELLQSLGADVIGVDPHVRLSGVSQLSLDDALPKADVLTLHCAHTAENDWLIGPRELELLPKRSVIVNTARGRLLDVETAAALLADSRLGGLVCDVFPEEPYPRLAAASSIDGAWFTPHSAGYSQTLGDRVASEVNAALRQWSESETLPHPVRPIPTS